MYTSKQCVYGTSQSMTLHTRMCCYIAYKNSEFQCSFFQLFLEPFTNKQHTSHSFYPYKQSAYQPSVCHYLCRASSSITCNIVQAVRASSQIQKRLYHFFNELQPKQLTLESGLLQQKIIQELIILISTNLKKIFFHNFRVHLVIREQQLNC